MKAEALLIFPLSKPLGTLDAQTYYSQSEERAVRDAF